MTQEQTNIALAALNLVLAGATVWLAIVTWRSALVTKASFELDARPYFAFNNFYFIFFLDKPEDDSLPPSRGTVKIGLIFRNPGRVLINYKVKSIRVTLAGLTIDNPKFEIAGGTIYPNDQSIFWYGNIGNVDISKIPLTGVVEYDVSYYAIDGSKHYDSVRKIQYTINSIIPVSSWDWIYLLEKDS